jgi:hypothetical protein
MSYGAQLKFGLARQTAGGAGNAVVSATSYHGMPLLSEDVGLEKQELISQNLIGKFEQGAVYSGVARIAGTITFEVTPRNLLAALAACVNWAPAGTNSGAIVTHTFLPNTQDFDGTYVKNPWTVYKQFTDAASAEQFYDVQFGQLELSIGQGQFLKGKLTANGGARTATGIGSLAVAPLTSDVGQLFPWNVASLSYGGVALGQASDLTITMNENIDSLYTVNGTLAPFKYTRTGFREVLVKGTFYMNDRSILNNFAADAQARLLLTVTNTKTAIQSGYYNSLTVDVPQMKITAFKPGASGPGEVSVNFQARGIVDPSSFYSIQFITVTSYQAGF